jgi:hypothetical protein
MVLAILTGGGAAQPDSTEMAMMGMILFMKWAGFNRDMGGKEGPGKSRDYPKQSDIQLL